MPSLQRIIDAGNNVRREKKKSVIMMIKNGEISREFVTSLSDLLLCHKNYNINTYMSDSDYYDDASRAFCEKNGADMLIFVQPMVGFCTEAINALVSDCTDLTCAHSCIPVPRRERSFRKVLGIVNKRESGSVDERLLESLASIFDINVKDCKIHLDDAGRFEADGFQPQDIVCVPLATMGGDTDKSKIKLLVHTRYTTSNFGVPGCLLDHLKNV